MAKIAAIAAMTQLSAPAGPLTTFTPAAIDLLGDLHPAIEAAVNELQAARDVVATERALAIRAHPDSARFAAVHQAERAERVLRTARALAKAAKARAATAAAAVRDLEEAARPGTKRVRRDDKEEEDKDDEDEEDDSDSEPLYDDEQEDPEDDYGEVALLLAHARAAAAATTLVMLFTAAAGNIEPHARVSPTASKTVTRHSAFTDEVARQLAYECTDTAAERIARHRRGGMTRHMGHMPAATMLLDAAHTYAQYAARLGGHGPRK